MPKKIASKEDWLKLGEELFGHGGKEALVVEQMSASLNVSKTSFYWHFKNKENFTKAVVEYWRKTRTYDFIEIANRELEPIDKLKSLIKLCFSSTPTGDFSYYLRKLSKKDAKYRKIIQEIELERICYVESLFQQCAVEPDKCQLMADIFYNYFVGWQERNKYEQNIAPLKKHMKIVETIIGINII
jgi:AcrR family transcriptional regulator